MQSVAGRLVFLQRLLDVDAPSKVTDKQVFSEVQKADRLLNAVYQSTCSGSTYGNAYLTTFNFNSDVEFSTSSAEEQSVSHKVLKKVVGVFICNQRVVVMLCILLRLSLYWRPASGVRLYSTLKIFQTRF